MFPGGSLVKYIFPCVFLQPLDFETKPSYTLKVEGANTHVDPSFRHRGPFKDVTIVHVSIEDVDEPPMFELPSYYIEVPEDAEVGTVLRTLSARDPDAANNTVRFETGLFISVWFTQRSCVAFWTCLELFSVRASLSCTAVEQLKLLTFSSFPEVES